MADDEILKRLDGHMARGNELTQRIEEELALNRRDRAETREFMRELTVRNERVTQQLVAEIKGLSKGVQGLSKGVLAAVRELADLREESHAQRDALLRMIDRLPPPQGA